MCRRRLSKYHGSARAPKIVVRTRFQSVIIKRNHGRNNTNKSEKTPRRRRGRRRSDWMVPLLLLLVALLVGIWAYDNYSKVQQLQEINKTLDVQSALLERLLNSGDRQRGVSSVPTPAPTTAASPTPTVSPA